MEEKENITTDCTPEMETTPRIWRRHHGSSLLDNGRRDTEWEAASRRLQGGAEMEVAMTSICSAGECGSFSLQKGRRGRRNKAGAVGERLG
ncbi:hypothetical protein PIB30_115143, partial [Stylosanthes scabra]|nr:hypothetical protein [Stylosanthes scabra]